MSETIEAIRAAALRTLSEEHPDPEGKYGQGEPDGETWAWRCQFEAEQRTARETLLLFAEIDRLRNGTYVNQLRDQLAIVQMKNALVSDVLRAAQAMRMDLSSIVCVGGRSDRLRKALDTWATAGQPGLIDE